MRERRINRGLLCTISGKVAREPGGKVTRNGGTPGAKQQGTESIKARAQPITDTLARSLSEKHVFGFSVRPQCPL